MHDAHGDRFLFSKRHDQRNILKRPGPLVYNNYCATIIIILKSDDNKLAHRYYIISIDIIESSIVKSYDLDVIISVQSSAIRYVTGQSMHQL